jgi:pimeloyl-ACP methyl ester carboxylesterase
MISGAARNGRFAIAYELRGSPGRPLVLLAGGGGQMVHWPEKFLDSASSAGFQPLILDNRDSGRSTHAKNGERYSLADMADDTVAVLDAIGWESAHVFGLSLGGMIGQVLAVHHPERVLSLTSVASASGVGFRISRPRLSTMFRILKATRKAGAGREATVDTWVEIQRIIGSPGYPFPEAEVRETALRAYDIDHDPDVMKRQIAAIKASGDRRKELARVRAPTLVVHGECDPLQNPRAGKATADAIPGARLMLLPGVGHGLPPEELWPQLFAAMAELADQPVTAGKPDSFPVDQSDDDRLHRT